VQTDWKGNSFAFAENGAKLQISTKKKQLVFNALKYGVIWNSELLITVFFKECFKQPLVFYKIKQYSFEVRGDESLQLRFGLTVR